MMQTAVSPSANVATQANPLSLADLEQRLTRSPTFAWGLITGLPALGIVAALFAGLPLFAALMAGCFLLATALTCRRAIATFTGKTLRLLVTARLVLVVVLGGLLFCTTGIAQLSVVSAVVLWLAADHLLGRRALHDLFKAVRGSK